MTTRYFYGNFLTKKVDHLFFQVHLGNGQEHLVIKNTNDGNDDKKHISIKHISKTMKIIADDKVHLA